MRACSQRQADSTREQAKPLSGINIIRAVLLVCSFAYGDVETTRTTLYVTLRERFGELRFAISRTGQLVERVSRLSAFGVRERSCFGAIIDPSDGDTN